MKITIDLENDSLKSLQKALELIEERIDEIDTTSEDIYLKHFNKKEITLNQLKKKIKDEKELNKILTLLKRNGSIYEPKKNVFMKI
jgi:DNA replicative helicase MCM subunit Mcm2 (Cdc46/Mcm family)